MPIIQFDLDGTLTEPYVGQPDNRIGTYAVARPSARAREVCNRAYAAGWTVTISTGRGEIYRAATEAWLRQHGIYYHFLFMGKLAYDVVVDDLGRTIEEFDAVLDGRRPLPLEESLRGPAPAAQVVPPLTQELLEADGEKLARRLHEEATSALEPWVRNQSAVPTWAALPAIARSLRANAAVLVADGMARTTDARALAFEYLENVRRFPGAGILWESVDFSDAVEVIEKAVRKAWLPPGGEA